MTDMIADVWRAQDTGARFTDPAKMKARLTRFEKQIRRRNTLEFAAGALVVVLCGAVVVPILGAQFYALAVAMALCAIGAIVTMWGLHRRASVLPPAPEKDCRAHYRAQLLRQRDALRAVPVWYLGPLMPGVVGAYLAVAFEVSKTVSWADIAADLGLPFVGTLTFFGFVAWLNLRAARSLTHTIRDVDAQ